MRTAIALLLLAVLCVAGRAADSLDAGTFLVEVARQSMRQLGEQASPDQPRENVQRLLDAVEKGVLDGINSRPGSLSSAEVEKVKATLRAEKENALRQFDARRAAAARPPAAVQSPTQTMVVTPPASTSSPRNEPAARELKLWAWVAAAETNSALASDEVSFERWRSRLQSEIHDDFGLVAANRFSDASSEYSFPRTSLKTRWARSLGYLDALVLTSGKSPGAPKDELQRTLSEAEADGTLRRDEARFERWRQRVETYLETAWNRETAVKFSNATSAFNRSVEQRFGAALGVLDALLGADRLTASARSPAPASVPVPASGAPYKFNGPYTGPFILDAPGSSNMGLTVRPGEQMKYAGLTFTNSVVASVLKDGTLLVDREGVSATDSSGKVWISGKTVLGGTNVFAFHAAPAGATPAASRQAISPRPTISSASGTTTTAPAGEARQTIEGELVDLVQRKRIDLEAEGSGIRGVTVRLRRLAPNPVEVSIPAGTYFLSRNSAAQNMVATETRRVRLASSEWVTVSVAAACANRAKDIPKAGDWFFVERGAKQKELTALMPVLDRANVPYAVRQAAVWIVTDNASYAELGTLVSRPASAAFTGLPGTRTITETDAATAMKICDEAGLDIKARKIWWDRAAILSGVTNQSLREWLQR